MIDFRDDYLYFYCPDYKKYVKCEKGIFYGIEDGKEKLMIFILKLI